MTDPNIEAGKAQRIITSTAAQRIRQMIANSTIALSCDGASGLGTQDSAMLSTA